LLPTDKYEISSLIRKLNDNKSLGPDNIGPKLVKCMGYAIIDPLEYIFNNYFSKFRKSAS